MEPDSLPRRAFLTGALAVGAGVLGWTPAFAVPAGSSGASLPVPPHFPDGVSLFQQGYQNWSKEIIVDHVWTCVPRDAGDVVRLVNWAHQYGYAVRPRGAMHGWTPLTVVQGAPVDRVILVDTTVTLTDVQVNADGTVTAGAGATLEAILSVLQAHGLGWVCVPAPGVLTIAGAVAVDAHGAALPATGEIPIRGTTYGSLSNLVTAVTAVVWDDAEGGYVLREFTRSQTSVLPLLTSLGRTFLTSVTLQTGANYRLRCVSTVDTSWRQMFAPVGGTFERAVEESGRAEAIWFPFTENPWLKVWTPTEQRPPQSREVHGPYNYPFSDNVPEPVTDLLQQLVLGALHLTPQFGQGQWDIVRSGLQATRSADIWGWSKDLLFYIKPTTLRLTEGGGAVITNRANIGQVVHTFTEWFHRRVGQLRAAGQFPVNGPVEIRCCGLDQPADVVVPSAGPPTVSALRPRPDHPEWDTAIWLNVLSTPGTPGMFAFYREMEQWMLATFTGGQAMFRPEWSKGWAFTNQAPYQDQHMLTKTVPNMYRTGYEGVGDWDTAVTAFDTMDPHRVFSNTFLDTFLP